jgi:hypothetical protein
LLLGYKWYVNFLKRHPEISIRIPEKVTKASGAISREDIEKWFAKVLSYLEKKNHLDILADPTRVWNGDETNVRSHPKEKGVMAICGSRNVYEVEHASEKDNTTIMFSFAACGLIVNPMVVFPYINQIPIDIARTIPLQWGIGKSPSGWMTGDLFHSYLENTFYPYLLEQNVKFPIIYFVDGHASHCTYEVSVLCARLNIILICLYPNATRILQPADVSIFKPLKSCWFRMIRKWRSENQNKSFTLKDLGPNLSKIMEDGFVSTSTIKNGFRACGLFPFNSQAVDYTKCLTTREKNDQIIEQNLNPENDSIELGGSGVTIGNTIADYNTNIRSQLSTLIGSQNIEDCQNQLELNLTGNEARDVLVSIIKKVFPVASQFQSE